MMYALLLHYPEVSTEDLGEEALAAVEADLPHPGVAIEALLPYERGDLLNRIHVSGEVESVEHTGDGSLVRGRVHEGLAGELEPYLVTSDRS